MIWDNFSIFRTNCAIACGDACSCCEDFCGCREGEMVSEIPEKFMLLAHNSIRLCLLEFAGDGIFVV